MEYIQFIKGFCGIILLSSGCLSHETSTEAGSEFEMLTNLSTSKDKIHHLSVSYPPSLKDQKQVDRKYNVNSITTDPELSEEEETDLDSDDELQNISRADTWEAFLEEYGYLYQYADVDIEGLPAEQRLMITLLRHYEKSVRPVRNATEIVPIRMGLTLTQIFDLDEKREVLLTNVWLDQEWDDIFLTWDPEEFDGIRTLRLPCHKLWLPDIVLYNNAAEYSDGLMPANAMITYEGEVFWPVPTKLQSTCKVDITYFPFDEQKCKLKFGSWTYDGFQVDMTNRTVEVDLSNYVENGEWQLISIKIERNIVIYACCVEPFPDVTFIIHIRRRTIYYLYNVIFPCVMMSVLTLLVFRLPPDSGEKITMGISVLLAFSVFLLRMGEDLPETSEFIPLLSIYLTIVMTMTSISVIMTVFVLNLHYRGPEEHPVPGWLRKIFLRGKVKRGIYFNSRNHEVGEYFSDSQARYIKDVSLRMTIENLAQELKEELDYNWVQLRPDSLPTQNYDGSHEGNLDDEFNDIRETSFSSDHYDGMRVTPLNTIHESSDHYDHMGESQFEYHSQYQHHDNNSYRNNLKPNCTRPHGSQLQSNATHTNEEILTALKKIIDRYEKDDTDGHIIHEWRQVAVYVDQILFWIFLTGTLSSTIIVLVVAPLTKFI